MSSIKNSFPVRDKLYRLKCSNNSKGENRTYENELTFRQIWLVKDAFIENFWRHPSFYDLRISYTCSYYKKLNVTNYYLERQSKRLLSVDKCNRQGQPNVNKQRADWQTHELIFCTAFRGPNILPIWHTKLPI